jgi:hypothetical protein
MIDGRLQKGQPKNLEAKGGRYSLVSEESCQIIKVEKSGGQLLFSQAETFSKVKAKAFARGRCYI